MLQFTEDYRVLSDGSVLDDDQVLGINFLLERKGAILSYQAGKGKTLTSLTACKIVLDNCSNVKVVVSCPVKALKAFRRELFGKFGYNSDKVGVISTNDVVYDVSSNDFFLFTDTNLEKYRNVVDEICDAGNSIILVIDEAHKIQDKSSKLVANLGYIKSKSYICWALTATPLLNGIDSLYNIVNFIVPKFFGTKTSFINRYTIWHLRDQYIAGGNKVKIREIDGYKNLDELNDRLSQIMIVRSHVYDVKFAAFSDDLSEREMDIYKKVSSGLLGSGDDRVFSRRLHDLQRFIDKSYESDESLVKLAKSYGDDLSVLSTKENLLVNSVAKCLSLGYSIIIYCDYKETIKRVHSVLYSKKDELGINNIYEVTGSVNIKLREAIEDRIDKRDIVLITSAGTESVDLQRCNCIIFYDLSFSIRQDIQAIGRICRVNTIYPKQYVMFIVMNGTIDEYKYRLFNNNLNLVKSVVCGGSGSDIPVREDYLIADSKALAEMKNQLLWAYKSSPKRSRKVTTIKKKLKDSIFAVNVEEALNAVAVNKFVIEPISSGSSEFKFVKVLYPDNELYVKFLNGVVPFTVLRSSYLDFLNSDRGKAVIDNLREGILRTGSTLFIGVTGLNKILKDKVIESVVSES